MSSLGYGELPPTGQGHKAEQIEAQRLPLFSIRRIIAGSKPVASPMVCRWPDLVRAVEGGRLIDGLSHLGCLLVTDVDMSARNAWVRHISMEIGGRLLACHRFSKAQSVS
jgi:hypothetical protein